MPHFKEYNQGQSVLLAVSFDRQILLGIFEYTLHSLIDNKLGLSIFHHKYSNDEPGRPADDPALRLRMIPFAYPRSVAAARLSILP